MRRGIIERLADGVVLGDGGYIIELECALEGTFRLGPG